MPIVNPIIDVILKGNFMYVFAFYFIMNWGMGSLRIKYKFWVYLVVLFRNQLISMVHGEYIIRRIFLITSITNVLRLILQNY